MTTRARELEPHPAVAPATGVTAGQLCLTFVPFGLGLVAAIWYAELSQDLRLFRTLYSVQVALLLAIPALALFPFRDRAPGVRNAWRLFWTFGFLAYAVHFAYAWFGVFGGQIATARLHPGLFHVPTHPTILDLVIAHQGTFVAYSNFAVTGLWLLDILLAWLGGGARGPARTTITAIHALSWLYVLVSFVIASIVFSKNNTILILGWTLVGVVALALLIRLFSREPHSASTTGH
jgi:hypothetical protein